MTRPARVALALVRRGAHDATVEIMLWWLPPALVTLGAMLWISWYGRARDEAPDRSEAAQARMGAALDRDLPRAATSVPRPRDRSTGIAVRPSQVPGHLPGQRAEGQAGRPVEDGRRTA